MRVYKTKQFGKFSRREGLDDGRLWKAAREIADGNPDADLGGGVFKQRVARPGGGKSGGYRTVVLHKRGDAYVLTYGFPKSAQANISAAELDAFRELADVYGGFSNRDFLDAIASKELSEIKSEPHEDEHEEDEGYKASAQDSGAQRHS